MYERRESVLASYNSGHAIPDWREVQEQPLRSRPMGWVALFSTHPKHEAHHELHHRSDDDRNALCKLRLRVAMYLFAHLHLRRELQLR